MADIKPVQQKFDVAKDQIRQVQNTQINVLPEDISSLIYQLRQVQVQFRAASRMSNVGASQFNEKLGQIISKLEKASQLVGDIRL